MYWQETEQAEQPQLTTDMVDLVFGIHCRTLPVDHAWGLGEAVATQIPWIKDEDGAGVHTIHVAASQNGWMRPEAGDALLYPSRRTKLYLRVPERRIEDARVLEGQTLDVLGHSLAIDGMRTRALSRLTTLFARYVVAPGCENEENFVAAAAGQLRELDVQPKKMLCGTETPIRTPGGTMNSRSLMLADLSVEESLALQGRGLGPLRYMGCGLFIPHKGIDAVGGGAQR